MTQTTLTGGYTAPNTDHAEWKSETDTYDGLTIKPLATTTQFGDDIGGPMLISDRNAWICEDEETIRDWLTDRKLATLEMPATYDDIKQFDPFIAVWNGKSSAAPGRGITNDKLEAALRTVTGGGRYNEDEFAIYPCQSPNEPRNKWVLETPDGFLLADYYHSPSYPEEELYTPSETFDAPYGEVEMMEENPTVLRGMEEVSKYLSEVCDIELAEHIEKPSEKMDTVHVFESAAGERVEIDVGRMPEFDHQMFKKNRENLLLWGGDTVEVGDNGGYGLQSRAPKPRMKGDYPFEVEMEVTADDVEYDAGDLSMAEPYSESGFVRVYLGTMERITAGTNVSTRFPVVDAKYETYQMRVKDRDDHVAVKVRGEYKRTTGDRVIIDPRSGETAGDYDDLSGDVPDREDDIPSDMLEGDLP